MRNVARISLDGWVAAERVVAEFGASGDVAWFDAGVDGDARGGVPREGHPRRSLVGWGEGILRASAADGASIAAAWERLALDTGSGAQDHDPLGWWGVIGFGASAELLEPGDAAWVQALRDPAHPDLDLLEVDRALVFDHGTGLVELVVSGEHDEWVRRMTTWWGGASVTPEAPESRVSSASPARAAEWADSGPEYLDLVARCQEAIRQGDAFVVCLTTRVTVHGVDESDLELYARLRRSSPAPRACFLRLGGTSILSASPETFVAVERGLASSSPIKGTRPRSADPRVDSALRDELRNSAKEQAENLMIVDLMRNDLSRVAVPGGVEVTELFAVRSYRHVHQLVSTVRARLRPGVGGVDVVRAAFPPGSMTGAPKHSAVGLVARWEAAARGFYSGAVGRFGLDGSVDLAVVIRTIVLDRALGTASVGVGGGITSASVPLEELAEIRVKARALLDVLGVSSIEGAAGAQDRAFDDGLDVSLL